MTDPAAVIGALYDACNRADAGGVRALLADDFTHHAIGPAEDSAPILRPEQLANSAATAARAGARWRVDRVIAVGRDVGVEYTMWLRDAAGVAAVRRGSEWIELTDDGRIRQIRSYHHSGADSDLEGYDYAAFDGAARPAVVRGAPGESRLGVIADYYDACTAADVDALMGFFTDDIVHYFLRPNVGSKPVGGREHLARYWRKVARMVNATWVVESLIARGDEAVIEWSMYWNPGGDGERIITRGMEWYVFDGRLMREIRSYHKQLEVTTELEGFAYAERGYSTLGREASALHTPRPEAAADRRP